MLAHSLQDQNTKTRILPKQNFSNKINCSHIKNKGMESLQVSRDGNGPCDKNTDWSLKKPKIR